MQSGLRHIWISGIRVGRHLKVAVTVAVTVAVAALLTHSAWAAGPAARIFACEPEWESLARELMPQAVVFSATHALQDPHHIEARPALIAQLRQADLAICTGAGLEEGWLPVLQERSGNPKVQEGAGGLFYASAHVSLLDPRAATLNPFAGDIHPGGNPHLHADPHRVLQVGQALAQTMSRLWPDQAAAITARHGAWQTRWRERIALWEQRARGLRGRSVAAQHSSFAYLWHWLGMRQTLDLEPKPGLSPTPSHLQSLLDRWKAMPPVAVVVAPHQDPRAGRWLTERAVPARSLLVLPATVPDPAAPQALERWFDRVVSDLVGAAQSAATAPQADVPSR